MLVDRKMAEQLAREFMEEEMGRNCAEALVKAKVAVSAMEQAARYPQAEFNEEVDEETALSQERDEAQADFDAALRLFLKTRLKDILT